ncbi:MAG: CPBP family glutamic-type intramembrane protease [bacterium]|nr:CPBP family glutamic-type intramembrane protease [bacterium]
MSPAGYLRQSSHPFYGALVALVMFMAYEILLVIEPFGPGGQIRNAPEAWMRTLFYFAGVAPQYLTFVLITFSLAALPLTYRGIDRFRPKLFLLMIPEAMLWGVASGIVVQWVLGQIFLAAGMAQVGLMTQLGLAIGAGLFEEFFFRVLLTGGLIWLFGRFWPRWLAVLGAVLLASLLFAWVHYIGSLGDAFSLYSFLFRFFGGCWFALLFAARGFAVVAMAHAFYDILVILS